MARFGPAVVTGSGRGGGRRRAAAGAAPRASRRLRTAAVHDAADRRRRRRAAAARDRGPGPTSRWFEVERTPAPADGQHARPAVPGHPLPARDVTFDGPRAHASAGTPVDRSGAVVASGTPRPRLAASRSARTSPSSPDLVRRTTPAPFGHADGKCAIDAGAVRPRHDPLASARAPVHLARRREYPSRVGNDASTARRARPTARPLLPPPAPPRLTEVSAAWSASSAPRRLGIRCPTADKWLYHPLPGGRPPFTL